MSTSAQPVRPEPRNGAQASPVTASALRLSNVVKKFDDNTVVNNLSFSVPPASVFALLGPNGAGKTTTIELCEGFQKPNSGTIEVLGMDPTKDPIAVRRRIGIMLQGGGAYPGIRVGEMLRLVASYSKNPLDPDWLLEIVGLSRHKRTNYRRLSGGQQQRLSLACALVGRPELVFLDEPTAGMDAQSRIAVWELIDDLRRDGVTVVLTTHLMDEAEALADNVVIIDKGTLVAEGSPAQLTQLASGSEVSGARWASIRIDTTSPVDPSLFDAQLSKQLALDTEVSLHAIKPLSYSIDLPNEPSSIAAVAAAIAEQGVMCKAIRADSKTLEDIFLDITGREMRN